MIKFNDDVVVKQIPSNEAKSNLEAEAIFNSLKCKKWFLIFKQNYNLFLEHKKYAPVNHLTLFSITVNVIITECNECKISMFCFAEASNTAVFHALCLLRVEKIEAVAHANSNTSS